MNLRPILDRIIIELKDPEETTAGGIVLANAKNEGVVEAEVLAVGPGAYNDKDKFIVPSVAIGNRILINAASGQKFTHDEEEYVSIVEDEIVAVLS
jgi:chaperonin GroES